VNELDLVAQAKAKLAALQDARAKREASIGQANELAQAQIALADAEAIEAAETEHGQCFIAGESESAFGRKIAGVRTDGGIVIVKRAHPAVFKRFQEADEMTTDVIEKLVMPCLVHPDKATLGKLLETHPAKLTECADAIAVLAGIRRKKVSGK
jgi:hypothetical protein